MRNKLLSLVLATALMLALSVPASAAGTTLKVIAPEGEIAEGESFKVTVEIEENPGIGSFQYILPYDGGQMTCTAAKGGEVIQSAMYITNPAAEMDSGSLGVVVAGATATPIEEDGVTAEIYFTANTALSSPEFTLTDVALTDEENKEIPFSVTLERVQAEVIDPEEVPDASSGMDIGVGDYDIPQETVEEIKNDPHKTSRNDNNSSSGTEGQTAPQETAPSGGETDPEQTAAAPRFPDIAGHWGEAFIEKAVELGLFQGGTDGLFHPNDPITRAQYVTVLYRMAGSEAVTATTPFTDIDKQNAEFKTAIAWAYDKGYIDGTSATTFDPTGPLTREAAMKILYYYAGGTEVDPSVAAQYDAQYTDSSTVSAWAKGPVYWGVFNELIQGTGGNHLSPQATATRATLAKILVNYLDKNAN